MPHLKRANEFRPCDVSSEADAGRERELASVESIVILDDSVVFASTLGRSFRALGFEVSLQDDCRSAQAVIANIARPHILVSELRLGGCSSLAFVRDIQQTTRSCHVVIATAYPSVATAVQAIRLGAEAYLAKPVTANLVLEALGSYGRKAPGADGAATASAAATDEQWPSLDRTVWEYLNQMLAVSGSISEAARRLSIDRRSLRRMLTKFPPAR